MGSHRIWIDRPPSIRIKDGVAYATDPDVELDHTLSLETLAECAARCQRALDRYAKGERDIIEDG